MTFRRGEYEEGGDMDVISTEGKLTESWEKDYSEESIGWCNENLICNIS